MSLTDDLYRDVILDHFRQPRHRGRLANPSLTAQGANPFCGDELELHVALEGEAIRDIRAEARGCSISQASASMMSEAVLGKTLEQAEELARSFKAFMLQDAPFDASGELEDLESLQGVKKYPVRIKCAILGWNTLLEGIAAHRKGQAQATHVEGEEGERPAEAGVAPPEPALTPVATQLTEASAPPNGRNPEEDEIREALKRVIDPELNLNIVDLGLIYGIGNAGGRVKVTYTLTSPGCPLGPIIQGQVKTALAGLPWVHQVETQLVWQPPWDPRTMASEEIKSELGIW